MKNNLLTFLSGRRSIRGQMLWNFVLSVFVATVVVNLLVYYLTQHTSVTKYTYISPPLLVPVPFVGSFLFFYVLFTRRIVQYMQTLADGLKLIAQGNLDYRLPLSRQDELGSIAQNINHMTGQLQKQLDRERRLEQSKMELISGVSHDLRTPLTSIIGYSNLLKSNAFQDENERKRCIDNVFNKTQQLKKLVDDLFEYTRLTSEEVQLHFQEVDLKSLLEQIVSEFEPLAREQGIVVGTNFQAAPMHVCIDIEKMVRAVENLLMNALKFTVKPGNIQVNLVRLEENVVLSIENKGTQITEEQEQRLFERFYKVESSRYDKDMPAGSGLGLSIAKNIVEFFGGRIWLEHNNGLFKFKIALPANSV